jgi:ATP/maltotriose-dependent transcriptional regulator MalT
VSQVTSERDHRTAPGPGFPLPEPKFHPPGTRPGIVVRTALVERLADTQASVITVTAPPGYGKTTLMAQWAQRLRPRVAWLSCDDADNDPVVLLTALATALCRIGPIDPAIFPALASSAQLVVRGNIAGPARGRDRGNRAFRGLLHQRHRL